MPDTDGAGSDPGTGDAVGKATGGRPATNEGDRLAYVLNPALTVIDRHVDGDYVFEHGKPVHVLADDEERVAAVEVDHFGRRTKAVLQFKEAVEIHAMLFGENESDHVPPVPAVENGGGS